MEVAGSKYVQKYGVDVIATEDEASGVLLCAQKTCAYSDTQILGLSEIGYNGKAMLRSVTLN